MRIIKSYDSKTCPNHNPIQLLHKNWSAIFWRPHRDDRNGYIICHIRSSESEDISRRVGFGKTGITLSYGLCLTWINTFFGNGTMTRTHPSKMSPSGAHQGLTGPIKRPIGLPLSSSSLRFGYVPEGSPTDLENCILAIDQGRLDRMVARHPLRTI
jgi:hypothetical protein